MNDNSKQMKVKPSAFLVLRPKVKMWTYFGFMADSARIISDKKKIACRICRAVIAYSSNTSNMTYHLQRMHVNKYEQVDIF